MSQPENDLAVLLRTMQPELHRGAFAFVTLPADAEISLSEAIATFREAEGMTVVVDEETAARRGWPVLFRAAWITLTVHSDLAAVGLTAAFARALGAAGISCNVMAAAYHDHIFVPFDDGPRALDALVALQRDAMRCAASGRRVSHRQKNGPVSGPANGEDAAATDRRRTAAYLTAPPSNQAASFTRSSSVMCVTLPIGIAFRRTACS